MLWYYAVDGDAVAVAVAIAVHDIDAAAAAFAAIIVDVHSIVYHNLLCCLLQLHINIRQ